jgi:hypothetical protein
VQIGEIWQHLALQAQQPDVALTVALVRCYKQSMPELTAAHQTGQRAAACISAAHWATGTYRCLCATSPKRAAACCCLHHLQMLHRTKHAACYMSDMRTTTQHKQLVYPYRRGSSISMRGGVSGPGGTGGGSTWEYVPLLQELGISKGIQDILRC